MEASQLFATTAHHELSGAAQHDQKLLLVAVFRKVVLSATPSTSEMEGSIEKVLDQWHMKDSPLLTPVEEERIIAAWSARSQQQRREPGVPFERCSFSLEDAYNVLFVGSLRDEFRLVCPVRARVNPCTPTPLFSWVSFRPSRPSRPTTPRHGIQRRRLVSYCFTGPSCPKKCWHPPSSNPRTWFPSRF